MMRYCSALSVKVEDGTTISIGNNRVRNIFQTRSPYWIRTIYIQNDLFLYKMNG
jgi:hypothetical protein